MFNYCNGNFNSTPERDIHDYVDIYLDPVIVIITFVLGYIISNLINKNQEIRKFQRVLEYFIVYYKDQISSVIKQLELIKEQSTKISLLKNTNGLGIDLINQP